MARLEDRVRPDWDTTYWSMERQSPGDRSFCFRMPKEVLEVCVVAGDNLIMLARQQAAHLGISQVCVCAVGPVVIPQLIK